MTEKEIQEVCYIVALLDEATERINALIGAANARNAVSEYRQSQFTFVPTEKEKSKLPESNSSNSLSLEELNEMLITLNIKFKEKLRKDGLYEITPTIGGKRVSIYGHSAEELASKYRKKIRQAKKVTSTKAKNLQKKKSDCMTLFAWFDEWLTVYKKPSVSKSTFLNLSRCIKKHIRPHLKDRPMDEYTMTELTTALNRIASTRMRKYARGVLQAAFAMAISAEKIIRSPAANLLPVKHIPKRGKAFALKELEALIFADNGLKREYWLYYLFCVFSGTRREEALSITRSDLDFENKTIHIPGTKTEGSDRLIPMFPILEKIIRATDQRTKKVFPLSQHGTDEYFKKFRGKNTDAVLHWLRHTFGTVQICAFKIPANTVAKWMGHSDASTTMDIYTHPEDLAPDIYYSGLYSEDEKTEILKERYNNIISRLEKLL